jgi:hypothetical protein
MLKQMEPNDMMHSKKKLHLLTQQNASLEASYENSKKELERLTALMAPLERAASSIFAARVAHPGGLPGGFSADPFGVWSQVPPFPNAGAIGGYQTQMDWPVAACPGASDVMSATLQQLTESTASRPCSMKQAQETVACGKTREKKPKETEDGRQCGSSISENFRAVSPKGTKVREFASPKMTPKHAVFSVMDIHREVPKSLEPQSAPAPRTRKPRTPQGRMTPTLSDPQRAPWSLLGSPGLLRSPAQKRPSWPGLMQSPVPASPFVIMEDGGTSFSFSLRKAEGVQLGMDFVDRSAGLVVKNVETGGAVEAWNRQCAGGPAAGKAVNPGDCVTSVNGITDVEGMRRECQEKALIRLTITRAGWDDEEECASDVPSHPRVAIPSFPASFPPLNPGPPPGLIFEDLVDTPPGLPVGAE